MPIWADGTLLSTSGGVLRWMASATSLRALVEGLASANLNADKNDGLFDILSSIGACSPSLGLTPGALWKRVVKVESGFQK